MTRTKTVSMLVRLMPTLAEQARETAKRQRRSLQEFLERAVENAVEPPTVMGWLLAMEADLSRAAFRVHDIKRLTDDKQTLELIETVRAAAEKLVPIVRIAEGRQMMRWGEEEAGMHPAPEAKPVPKSNPKRKGAKR